MDFILIGRVQVYVERYAVSPDNGVISGNIEPACSKWPGILKIMGGVLFGGEHDLHQGQGHPEKYAVSSDEAIIFNFGVRFECLD